MFGVMCFAQTDVEPRAPPAIVMRVCTKPRTCNRVFQSVFPVVSMILLSNERSQTVSSLARQVSVRSFRNGCRFDSGRIRIHSAYQSPPKQQAVLNCILLQHPTERSTASERPFGLEMNSLLG